MPHDQGPDYVLHLQSFLSAATENLFVVFEPLAPVRLLQDIKARGIDHIAIDKESYHAMGCNILAVRPGVVVMVDGVPNVRKALEEQGRRSPRLRRQRPLPQGRRRPHLPDCSPAPCLAGRTPSTRCSTRNASSPTSTPTRGSHPRTPRSRAASCASPPTTRAGPAVRATRPGPPPRPRRDGRRHRHRARRLPARPARAARRPGPRAGGPQPRHPPDVLIVDATGRDHPRRAGLATHLGAQLRSRPSASPTAPCARTASGRSTSAAPTPRSCSTARSSAPGCASNPRRARSPSTRPGAPTPRPRSSSSCRWPARCAPPSRYEPPGGSPAWRGRARRPPFSSRGVVRASRDRVLAVVQPVLDVLGVPLPVEQSPGDIVAGRRVDHAGDPAAPEGLHRSARRSASSARRCRRRHRRERSCPPLNHA